MCFDFLYKFETFLILKRSERDLIKMYIWPSFKVPFILVRF